MFDLFVVQDCAIFPSIIPELSEQVLFLNANWRKWSIRVDFQGLEGSFVVDIVFIHIRLFFSLHR